MKITLPLFLNTVILLAFLFTANLLALSFLSVPFWLKVTLALMLSLSVSVLVFFKWQKNSVKKSKLKQSKQKTLCDLATLNLLARTDISKIFRYLFKNLNLTFKETNGYFLVNGAVVYPFCLPESLSFNEVKRTIDTSPYQGENFLIISDKFNESLKIYKDDLGVTLIDTEAILPLLNRFDLLPKTKTTVKKTSLFRALFKKVNGRRFIIYGIALVAMSFIVFYPIYYLVSGVFFIVFGLIAVFFGKSDLVILNNDFLTALNIKDEK